MLQKLMEGTGRGYVTLDDLNERNIAKTDAELFLQCSKGAVICMKPGLSAIDRDNYIVPIWMI